MNHFTFSALLVFVFGLLATFVSWFLRVPDRSNRLLAMYWLSITFWAFFVGTQSHTIEIFSPFWWGWFLHFGCTFIPILLFHFTIVFTQSRTKGLYRVLIVSYVITILFNILNAGTIFFTNGTAYRDAYAYPKPAFLYPAYFILFIILVSWSTLLLVKYAFKLPALIAQNLKLMFLTQVLAYVGGMDNFLIMVDIRLPLLYPFGLYLVPLYALATMHVVFQYNRREQKPVQ